MDIAFFDFDGTITTGDGFMPFVRRVASRRRMLAGTLGLSPLVAGYRLGWVSGRVLRTSIAWCAFRGRALEEIQSLGARYAREVLPERVRPQARERLDWHRARGDAIVVVSASLDAYLAPWCKARGFELICTELEAQAGVCTGGYREGDCSGPEKARRIRARYDLRRYEQVFAYGDTVEDREMLGLASHPFFRWQALSRPRAAAGGAE